MTSSQPLFSTWQQASQAIRAGQVTVGDALNSCLAQIDAREPEVHAWALLDRAGALRQASALDDEVRSGRLRGPLHGIPVGIKDIIDVAGWPTTAGYSAWADRVAESDSDIVARLKAAGAVILGKTITTQFAGFDPPVTRNPHDVARTPGGSSSGSAAAVAAGMCFGAIGTQTGGSITRPASFCGDAACKPTFGRVPLTGVVPLSSTLDHGGPIARCVTDVALLLDALTTPPGMLATSSSENLVDELAREPATPPRLARLGGFFEEMSAPEMTAAMTTLERMLKESSAASIPLSLPPSFDHILARHKRLISAGAASVHGDRLKEAPQTFLPRIAGMIQEGLTVSSEEVAQFHQHQGVAREEILKSMEGFDALLCPATLGAAPDASTTGDPSFNSPWSFTGLPVVSFRIGRSSEGLPLCLQLVGRPDGEASLLRTAAWLERRVADHAL